MAALNITTNIVTSIVTVPGFGFTADSIEGGHNLYQQARSLLDQIAGSCDAQTCHHLTNSISAELDAIEGQLVESGYDRSHIDSFIDHLEASVKQTITLLADDENALREAILKPEVFRYYVLVQSSSARQNYTPGELQYLDTLLGSVAQEYLTLAPASPDFKHTALERTITALTQISHQQTTKDPTHSTGENHLDTLTEHNNLVDDDKDTDSPDTVTTQYGHVPTAVTRILNTADPNALTRVLDSGNLDALTSRHKRAKAYQAAGRLDEAIDQYRTLLTDCARTLRKNHPKTLATRNNLAYTYRLAGRLDEAITEYEILLIDYTRAYSYKHPKTSAARNKLAYTYCLAGRFVEAIPLYEQVIKDRTCDLGEDHPRTLAIRHSLANVYRDAGRLDEAITLYEQVITDSVRVLGEDHRDTLTTHENLADTYVKAGRFDEAIAQFKQVITDRTRVLGEDHPDTLTSRHNLADTYRKAGRTGEAIALYEQVATGRARVLGPNYPDTLTSRHNLANIYLSVGRFDEAITLYENLLPNHIRVLGADHPDTLTSRHNLAYAYESADRLSEAITLYEQVATDHARVLGEDHPDTLSTREELAHIYVKAGRTITSPVTGTVVPLDEVEDEFFSRGRLGPGIGIEPADGLIVAPFDGTVTVAFSTGHAYGLKSASGVQVLIHVGIDTVELYGKGFTPRVSKGDDVKRGDVLTKVDLDVIRAAGHKTITPIVVTNKKEFGAITPLTSGEIQRGDALLNVASKEV